MILINLKSEVLWYSLTGIYSVAELWQIEIWFGHLEHKSGDKWVIWFRPVKMWR